MTKHSSDGVLRRLLDEPAAVSLTEEDHARSCSSCQSRLKSLARDEAAVTLALPAEPALVEPAIALRRFQALDLSANGSVATPAVVAAAASTKRREQRHLGRRWGFRPVAAVTAALIITGGATAAAATHWAQIFQPQSVAPISVHAGDLSGLLNLSQFGDFSGQPDLQLTPEGSAQALASASGYSLPQVQLPADLPIGSPSYWKVGADSAQLTLSVAKIDQSAAAMGATAPPAPAGTDGSVIKIDTGTGALEVWLGDTGGSSGLGSLVHHAAHARGASGSSNTDGSNTGGAGGVGLLGQDLPELAVAEVPGPTVSTSGADLSTLENYLVSQPELSPSLAAEIRAIGSPGSTLPVPVPALGSSSTVDVDGHTAVLYSHDGGALVVWASGGRLFAVEGQASTTDVLNVADQIG